MLSGNGSLDQSSTDWATEAVAVSLGASYVYSIGCNAGEVLSYIKDNIGIYTCCQQIDVLNSSVRKIYILRPNQGPVAKNATPRPPAGNWTRDPDFNLYAKNKVYHGN